MASKPNLQGASCVQLTVAARFPLGRSRLAEDLGVKPRQLLKQPVTLREEYLDATERPWQLTATFTLVEEKEEGPDQWSCELAAARPEQRPRPADGTRRPTLALKHLGKMSIESNFDVNAIFLLPEGMSLRVPKVPTERAYAGGAFTHLIGYTLANVRDLQVLYEVAVRWLGNRTGVSVGFTYRRKLDDSIFDAALDRASGLFAVTLAPVSDEQSKPPAEAEKPQGFEAPVQHNQDEPSEGTSDA